MSGPGHPSAAQWPEAARWLERARDDLSIVEILLAQPSPSLLGAALHCQQAAEKMSKATLIAFGVRPPHIHDVGELAEQVAAVHPNLGREIGNLTQLTAWYISSRYPDVEPDMLPSLTDIRLALAKLRQIDRDIQALAPKR